MKTITVILGTAVLSLGGVALALQADATTREAHRLRADSLARVETELLDRDIAFFAERAERDPTSAAERASLAARYLQRARETGNYQDNQRAEAAARASLARRESHNGATKSLLVASLLAQHRFDEANGAARAMAASNPTSVAVTALLGETYLEMGRYDSARVAFGSLGLRRDRAVGASLARWDEISGRLDRARHTFAELAKEAWTDVSLRREQIAWYQLRSGELELKRGRLAAAEGAFRRGLSIRPSDHRVLAAMARLELSRERPTEALYWGERAIAEVAEPATFGILADAAMSRGDSARAGEYLDALEALVAAEPGSYHRAVSLVLLDHGRQTAKVLDQARQDIVSRPDIYGYDLLAWALYRAGQPTPSRAAMEKALTLDTEDALLLFHAGVIAHAGGDLRAAADYLQRALDLNPFFHPIHRREAERLLASIRSEIRGAQ